MKIRAINQDELRRFAAVSFPLEDSEQGQQVVADFWTSGESRPEWCIVAEDGDAWLGSVFFRNRGDGVAFYDLQVNADQNYQEIGSQLLLEGLRQLYAQGVQRFVRNFQTGEPHVEKWRSLLDNLKILPEQEKPVFTWKRGQTLPVIHQRLNFQSLNAVGEAAFVDAIQRVTEGTLDRVDQADRAQSGPQSHAQEFYDLLKDAFYSRPIWWELAYTADNQLVGLHIPVLFGEDADEGTIGYIGVVPEQRGQGYIHDMLARCTEILLNTGITTITSDTDSLNIPMIKAFEQAGYQPAGTAWAYAVELATLFD